MIKIQWLGHSAFYLRFPKLRAVIDPFPPSVGFKMKKMEADLVLVTHNHFDHSYIEGVKGNFMLINGPGEYEFHQVRINGWLTYHDKEKGQERGLNTIYQLLEDNFSLLHLGDLGHPLEDELVEKIGQVDVLFVPVGGFYTLPLEDVIKVIDQLEPHYVIPMHYRTVEHSDRFAKIDPLDVFLKEMGVKKEEVTQPQLVLKIAEKELPTQVVVLEREK